MGREYALEKQSTDRGARRRPIRGGSIGELQSSVAADPAFDCCCGDHCPGDYGGPHCNASTEYRLGDFDTTEHGYLHRDGLACHSNGDPDGNDGSNRDDSDPFPADSRP
jgi:hypothetical protein